MFKGCNYFFKSEFEYFQGVLGFRQAVARSPPLAMAIAMDEHRGIDHSQSARIEFPIVEVASAIGWSSGQVKAHLKDLEWKKSNFNFFQILLNNYINIQTFSFFLKETVFKFKFKRTF